MVDLEHDGTASHGNFWALLQFRAAAGDLVLREHLSHAPRNATYTSPDIQNQIIDILGSTKDPISCSKSVFHSHCKNYSLFCTQENSYVDKQILTILVEITRTIHVTHQEYKLQMVCKN